MTLEAIPLKPLIFSQFWRILYCKGKIRTTPLAASFWHLFAHLPCNTSVLLRHLHKNLAQKSSRQRCKAIKSGKTCVSDEVRSALCASARCAVRALRTKKSRFQQRFRARGGTLHWCRREKGAGRAVWHGQAFQQSMSAAVSAFDRVRITPLQYTYSILISYGFYTEAPVHTSDER